jgi:hypothetical protein
MEIKMTVASRSEVGTTMVTIIPTTTLLTVMLMVMNMNKIKISITGRGPGLRLCSELIKG